MVIKHLVFGLSFVAAGVHPQTAQSVFVIKANTGEVIEIDELGTKTTFAALGAATTAWTMKFAPNGDLFVMGQETVEVGGYFYESDAVYKVDPLGTVTVFTTVPPDGVLDLAVSDDGKLFALVNVSIPGGTYSQVWRLFAGGGKTLIAETTAALPVGLSARGMSFGPSGHLYLAMQGGGSQLRILRVTLDGQVSVYFDSFVPGSHGLDVRFNQGGDMFILARPTSTTYAVWKVEAGSSGFSVLVPALEIALQLTIDDDENLYVSGGGFGFGQPDGRVYKIDPQGDVSILATFPGEGPIADIDDQGVDPQTEALTHFVDASAPPGGDGLGWSTAFQDLQSALSAAEIGNEVWVAAGVYTPAAPGGSQTASFQIPSNVRVYGGFLGTEESRSQRAGLYAQTILSGDLNGDDDPPPSYSDNAFYVVDATVANSGSVLDGFTITAGRGGGGMNADGGSPRVFRCTFQANTASGGVLPGDGRGAGAYCGGSGEPEFVECAFIGNSCDGASSLAGGGGVYVGVGSASFEDCYFADNHSTGALGGGGGIRVDGGSADLDSCVLENNTAGPGIGGGALYAGPGATLSASDCTVVSNVTALGGGLVVDGADAIALDECTFSDNLATSAGGGAFVAAATDVTITACTFRDNTATDSGGALQVRDSAAVTVLTSSFVENETTAGGLSRGGALYFEGGAGTTSNVIDSEFLGNPASGGQGGAIYVEDGSSAPPAVVNCVFSGNSALDGGAVWSSSSSAPVTLVGCTFSANSASGLGGGLYLEFDADVVNSVLWGNTSSGATLEDQQVEVAAGNPNVDYSCIEGLTGSLGGTGNTGSDPLFLDPLGPDGLAGTEDDSVRVGFGSSCIDAGNGSALPTDAFDVDGDANTGEPTPPRGSGERVLDGDGIGAAVVDMGAVEFPTTASALVDGDGNPVELNPGGGTGDPLEDALATLSHNEATPHTVAVSETSDNLHPSQSGFGVFGKTLVVETDLAPGTFFLTLQIPFSAAELAGNNPLNPPLRLLYFDIVQQDWVLAVAGNTGPPGIEYVEGTLPPDPPDVTQRNLGDYGVFWDGSDGFVWANVDHTTDFSLRLFQDCNADGVDDLVETAGGQGDADGNGVPDECDCLRIDRRSLLVKSGATATFTIDAGVERRGQSYHLLGTVSGTAPGTVLGGASVPLNQDDYFDSTLNDPGSTPLLQSVGVLDGLGRATAQFSVRVPEDVSLIGLSFHHAFVLFESSPFSVTFASNPVPLVLRLKAGNRKVASPPRLPENNW